ncbi:MAG: AAA family ATPase [Candidatus Riflebacteria bacterium]|nr:AAA family ATPase [Candidatus Riflebacteria bacterium]
MKNPNSRKILDPFTGKELQESQNKDALFNIEKARITDFLDKPPKPVKNLVENFLTKTPIGAISAKGGMGKGQLCVHLGISLASGIPLFNNPKFVIPETGSVLMLNLEDDRREYHRRYSNCFAEVTRALSSKEVKDAKNLVLKNTFIPPVANKSGLSLAPDEGNKNINRIIDFAEKIPELRIIFIDPIILFFSLDICRADYVGNFINNMKLLHQATKAMIILVTHANKSSQTGETEVQMASGSLMGSNMFVNASRIVITMATPTKKTLAELEILGHPNNFVMLQRAKGNYLPPATHPILLERVSQGALRQVHFEHEDIEPVDYIEGLLNFIKDNQGIAKTRLLEEYRKSANISRNEVETVLKKLKKGGRVEERATGKNNQFCYFPKEITEQNDTSEEK